MSEASRPSSVRAAAPWPSAADETRLAPAFLLACACCQWPPSPRRDERVRRLAAGVDWSAFLRVIARQRIPGLAAAALKAAGVAAPDDAASELAAVASGVQKRALALAAESRRLQARFAAEGLRSLVIKGAPLAAMAYGSTALKHGRDIDLVVAPADAETGLRLLQADGYSVLAPPMELTLARLPLVFRHHKDIELFHPQRRTHLELHWRLIDNPEVLKNVGVDAPSQTVDVNGAALETLADRELFAYLCVHGASHAWFRLKWLADLNAWLAGKSADDILAFYDFAVAEGVGDCAGQALRLCRRLLDLELPPRLADRLQGARSRYLEAAAVDAMAGGRGEIELFARPFGPFRLAPSQFLRGRGPRFLWAQVGLLAVSLDDMLTLPLPRPLHFLYPLLRLPLWLGRVARRRLRRPAAAPAVSAASQGPS